MNVQVSLGEGIQYKIWNVRLTVTVYLTSLQTMRHSSGTNKNSRRGTAKEAFSTRQPKGEITLLIEGNSNSSVETPPESQLENDLRELISNGHSLSSAVKLVAEGTSMKKKTIYSLALRKFVKKTKADDSD
ncbi:ribosomal RNA small subunit methyltransferase I-like isoform X1 [Gossypium australe]|uniref:Ribosomal RNA small subunit methyltransferase I-like isoform X1 n=1 Tax=Gossypium australe TaxID=47621 RepID=A0A5B6W549_9ROSI|nr:ribosomal RNA small subunit methyltransferase I-like isoform X1 [Gossypium australe]